MVSLGEFNWAYFFSLCAFVWSVGAWITSETLRKKLKPPTRRQRRSLAPYSRRGFLLWKCGGVGFITIVFVGSVAFIYEKKLTKELQSLKGRLIPASDPTPPSSCGDIPHDAVILFFGDNASIARGFPHNVLVSRILGPVIVLDRSREGYIAVRMDIRTADGKIVVRLNEDGFNINAHTIWEMSRPDRSTLIVTDEYGGETLNIRYLNSQAMRITGSFHYPGQKESTPLQLRGAHNFCLDTGSSVENPVRADVIIP